MADSRRPCCAVALRRTAWSEHGMASVNLTEPHCVNQIGKTHSKPLAARRGRGTAWARHGNGMLCVNRPLGWHGVVWKDATDVPDRTAASVFTAEVYSAPPWIGSQPVRQKRSYPPTRLDDRKREGWNLQPTYYLWFLAGSPELRLWKGDERDFLTQTILITILIQTGTLSLILPRSRTGTRYDKGYLIEI